jgi:hypothetical protein
MFCIGESGGAGDASKILRPVVQAHGSEIVPKCAFSKWIMAIAAQILDEERVAAALPSIDHNQGRFGRLSRCRRQQGNPARENREHDGQDKIPFHTPPLLD